MQKDLIDAGQSIYSKKVLSIYDIWVLGFSNHLLWKCPTHFISDHFKKHVSSNHLDVGVGSGYYLKKHLPANTERIALLDLNENSLQTTAKAVSHFNVEIYKQNVLEPIDLNIKKFDSISINYLLHCLPGTMSEKAIIFTHLQDLMQSGATLFGSTILGTGVRKNFCANKLMSIYNQKKIFSNLNDDLKTLKLKLTENFTNVEIKQIGCVAIFSACKI